MMSPFSIVRSKIVLLLPAILYSGTALAQDSFNWSAAGGTGSAKLIYDRYIDGMYVPDIVEIDDGLVTAQSDIHFSGDDIIDGSISTTTTSQGSNLSLGSGAYAFLCESCLSSVQIKGDRSAGEVFISPDWYGIDSWFVGTYRYAVRSNGRYDIIGETNYYINWGSPYGGDAFFESHFAFSDVQISFPGVPEPATWFMLLGGLGCAGAATRLRFGRGGIAIRLPVRAMTNL